MGDHERGAAFHQVVQRLLDHGLVLGVDAGESLIQYQDGRVFQQRPGDGDTLFLPAGQPHRPLSDDGVVALWEVADEIVGVGRFSRRHHLLLGRVGSAEAQVLRHGAVEQVGVLGHHGHLFPQLIQGYLPDIGPAQQDAAALWVEETQYGPDDGGFARAAGAHQAQGLAGVQGEGKVVEGRPASAAVGVVDALKGHFRR